MAKYYRYMSIEEFNKLLAGCIIKGKDHRAKSNTTSVGVCFLAEETPVLDDYLDEGVAMVDAEKCYDFLSGIVSKDVLVEFETDMVLEESSGVYASPFNPDWFAKCVAIEYCINEYSREVMRPLRYTVDPGKYGSWKWYPVK